MFRAILIGKSQSEFLVYYFSSEVGKESFNLVYHNNFKNRMILLESIICLKSKIFSNLM